MNKFKKQKRKKTRADVAVFGSTPNKKLGRAVAQEIGVPFGELRMLHFPDGELCVRFMKPVCDRTVVLIHSIHPLPQDAFCELLFACIGARQQGAKKVIAVIPYLGFMRQDKMFHAGEVVSSRAMGVLLAAVADKVITIDPHLHRHKSLNEVFPIPSLRLSATKTISQHIEKHWKKAIIVGPDGESDQWAAEVARLAHCQVLVVKKKRYTASKVRTKVKDIGFKGKTVIIVDDIISTGHTMQEVAKQVWTAGARAIVCIGVHGVFAKGALSRLECTGARVMTTDTIRNPVSSISVAKLIAGALH